MNTTPRCERCGKVIRGDAQYLLLHVAKGYFTPETFPTADLNGPLDQGGFQVGPECYSKVAKAIKAGADGYWFPSADLARRGAR